MLAAILIIIAASVSLSALTVLVLFRMGRLSEPDEPREDGNVQYYDEDGNHLYYDRKLIARQGKERAEKRDK